MGDPVTADTGAPRVQWETIPGCGNYEVSEDGQVRRARGGRGTWAGRLLRQDGGGRHPYLRVRIYQQAHLTRIRVHTAVLLAFVGPRPPGQECRHLDGNPLNNQIANLTWGTPSENAADKRRHQTQLRGEQVPQAILTEAAVRDIRDRLGSETRTALAAEYGVARSTLDDVATGRSWGHVT